MAAVHGKDTVCLLGGYDLTAYFNDISISRSTATAETTTFGSASVTKIAGLKDAGVSLSGIWDGAASAVDDRLSTMFGTEGNVASFGFGGTTLGSRGILTSGIYASYEITASLSDAVGVSAEIESSGGADSGKWHHALGSEAVAQNSASVDNAASSANGYATNLHATAITGTPVGVIKIQHSTDNSVWADLVTFATVTGITSEQKTGTGTVNRYTRSQLFSIAGASSVTFADIFARR